jgi:cytochrome-b5 reductase
MVAGGTGITPFYQLIQHIQHQAPEEGHKVPELKLIYANRTSHDILLKEDIEKLAGEHRGLSVSFSIDVPEEDEHWEGHAGFIDKEYLEKEVGAPEEKKIIMFCGPPKMNEFIAQTLLELGHDESNILKY